LLVLCCIRLIFLKDFQTTARSLLSMGLLLLASALAAGFSPLAVPVLEDQLWTAVKWTSVTTGKWPQSRSGQHNVAYDPPNQRFRQSGQVAGNNQALIADYKSGVGYRISNGVCLHESPDASQPSGQADYSRRFSRQRLEHRRRRPAGGPLDRPDY
jgi:hypothetical protein